LRVHAKKAGGIDQGETADGCGDAGEEPSADGEGLLRRFELGNRHAVRMKS